MRFGSGFRRWTACGVAVLALGACGGDDSAGTEPSVSATLLSAPPGATRPPSTTAGPASTSTLPGSATSTQPSGPGATTAAPGSASTTAPTTTAPSTSTTPTTPPTEPTGVPGSTSAQPMCRDYATVVGTQSVLTIAGAFGELDAVALARLELLAAPAVVASADALAGEWPAELASEQAIVESGVVGPIVTRARQALAAVTAAGIDQAELDTAWRTTLTTYDPADPVVPVRGIAPGTESQLTVAASAYAATTTRYDQDGSVRRTAATPLTTQFLFDRCPELSYLITGDGD